MRLEPLIRAIEAADVSSFREIVLHTLIARGYDEVHLTDGPYDGGRDVRVYRGPLEADDLVIQISVDKDWRSKVRDDASKAHGRNFERMDFYSSCRIPPASRIEVKDEIRRTMNGFVVEFFDSQAIGNILWERGRAGQALKSLGLEPGRPDRRAVRRPDLRQEVAFAAAFFGAESRAFREAVLENAILIALDRSGPGAAASDVLAQVSLELRLGEGQQEQLAAALDRLRQRSEIIGRNGHISLGEGASNRVEQGKAWAQACEQLLRDEVRRALSRRIDGAERVQRGVDALMKNIQAILTHIPDGALSALGDPSTDLSASLRRQHEELLQTIVALGVSNEGSLELVREIGGLLEQSDWGRMVAAGELFLQIGRLGMPQLLGALGGYERLEIVLDASVAMPMLCALWQEPRDGVPSPIRFFRSATVLWDRCEEHQISPVLPIPYLEEIASHLLYAWRDYRQLIGVDPDLAASTNAFVAHFSALSSAGRTSVSFEAYLESFGLKRHLAMAQDFKYARDTLMTTLAVLFRRYGIQVQPCSPGPLARKQAQELLSWVGYGGDSAESRKALERPDLLIRHDEQVIGALIHEVAATSAVWVLCTWDGVLRNLRGLPPSASVIDPLSLADLLGLAGGSNMRTRLSSPPIMALALSSEARERGARVIDQLVHLERAQIADSAITEQITAFKKDFMARAGRSFHASEVERRWDTWRLRTLGSARPHRASEEPA